METDANTTAAILLVVATMSTLTSLLAAIVMMTVVAQLIPVSLQQDVLTPQLIALIPTTAQRTCADLLLGATILQ